MGEFARLNRDFRMRRVGWWIIVVIAIFGIFLFLNNTVNAQAEDCPRYHFTTGDLITFPSFNSTGKQDARGRCQIFFRGSLESEWIGRAFVQSMEGYSHLTTDVITIRYRLVMERGSNIVKEAVELSQQYDIIPMFYGVSFQSYRWDDTSLKYLNDYTVATFRDEYGQIVLFPDGSGTGAVLIPDTAHG